MIFSENRFHFSGSCSSSTRALVIETATVALPQRTVQPIELSPLQDKAAQVGVLREITDVLVHIAGVDLHGLA